MFLSNEAGVTQPDIFISLISAAWLDPYAKLAHCLLGVGQSFFCAVVGFQAVVLNGRAKSYLIKFIFKSHKKTSLIYI